MTLAFISTTDSIFRTEIQNLNIRSPVHILEFLLHDRNSCGQSTDDVTMREFLDASMTFSKQCRGTNHATILNRLFPHKHEYLIPVNSCSINRKGIEAVTNGCTTTPKLHFSTILHSLWIF